MVRSQPGQIVHETPISKHLSQKTAGVVAQCVGPEFKPQHCKKEKEKKTWETRLLRKITIPSAK
jgi:hypothetical protein